MTATMMKMRPTKASELKMRRLIRRKSATSLRNRATPKKLQTTKQAAILMLEMKTKLMSLLKMPTNRGKPMIEQQQTLV